ncbi:MAG: alginate export family protein [Flavobacteriaceae bacterium]|jgi:hypothetical protein|nr:alginate export family protein [Flavobacteriaceae bacterium]
MRLQTNILLILLCFSSNLIWSQFQIGAELRNRTEYRHGYKTLFADDIDPAFFNAQRTRLNMQYTTDGLKIVLSVQDVRTWGDVAQLNVSDNNGMSLHQAYAELKLSPAMALKVGRQEIVYDDARFMGNVDWTTQGRSHDAALLKYSNEKTKFEMGFAYNQASENLTTNTYSIAGNYKTLQYAWFHHDFEHLGMSILLLNNGLQYINTSDASQNETRFSQTAGTHLKFKKDKFSVLSNLYYQFGKDVNDNKLGAYLVSLDLNHQTTEKFNFGAGVEFISGNEYGVITDQENHAFNPMYGTNHKFNGHMDYFYVGNHLNSVGLMDVNLTLGYKISPKHSLTGFFHQFSAAQDINNTLDSRGLGTEVDLAFNYKFAEYGTFTLGYSQMFAKEGLEVLKGNNDGNSNSWAFAMLTLKPNFFTNK